MSWEILFVFALLVAALTSFMLEKLPTDLTALAMFAVLLLVSGLTGTERLPDINGLIAVFSNPAPITIAAMFVISAALERCGLIEALSRSFTPATRLGYRGFLGLLILVVAFLSAFMNNTPVVVVMLPVVLSLSRSLGVKASKLLIPLSYAAILGGSCTLIGSSTNILASGIMSQQGLEPLTMFELAKIGLFLLVTGMTYLMLFGRRLLPDRETLTAILSDEERREYLMEAFIRPDSELIGQPIGDSPLQRTRGVRILEVIRRGVALAGDWKAEKHEPGDRLVLSCRPTGIVKAHRLEGVSFLQDGGMGLEQIAAEAGSLVEGVISPGSSLIGYTFREMQFRQRFRMIPIAIHRHGKNVREKLETLPLEPGDTLLMMGTDQAIEFLRHSNDILLLDKPHIPARDLRAKQPIVIATIVGVVGAATFNLMPIVAATVIGVAILFLTGCLKPKEGYAAVDWSILVLIFAMLGLGRAMEQSGATAWIAGGLGNLLEAVPPAWLPWVLVGLVYALTCIFTETLSNNATVVLMTPLAIGLAGQLGLEPRPFVIAACIAASASFITPIGYQTNTYVYSVGGYRFSDFPKIGLPLALMNWVVAMVLIPVLWPV
ncbi:MAG: SLC13 family permease [Opitutales bacterium]